MSRRKEADASIVPGTSLRIICTGGGAHPEVTFGKSAITEGGKVLTEITEPRAQIRNRREVDPELASSNVAQSRSINRQLKSLRFDCPQCSLDYQRRGEVWREIVKVYHASGWKVLDLSKLPV